MSTDDRHSDQPEFPMRDADGNPVEQGAVDPAAPSSSTPGLPDMPSWEAPAGPAVVIPEPIEMPAQRDEPDEVVREETVVQTPGEDAAGLTTREPIGGPYVVDESGAPIAEQAVIAYDREPLGGPYVTASEPEPEPEAQPSRAEAPTAPAERTPYPAAAFVPAAAAAATAPAPVGETYPAYQQAPQPVSAPLPPKNKGNRGAGSLIALAGTVLFALVYAGVGFLIILANLSGSAAVSAFTSFLLSAAFIVPVVVFALALILIVLIVNRAGWWAYVLGGFLVAVLVYVAAIAGALIHVNAWNLQPQQQYDFVRSLTMDPLTLAAAIVAREVAIWTGAFIALRGRRVKARNAAAREEFERTRREELERPVDTAPSSTTW